MKTSKTLFAAACAALATASATAQTPGAALNLGAVQPSPGWGNTCTYNVSVTLKGKPVKNARVEFFFSGQHGLESPPHHLFRTTNAAGFATFSTAIPRNWNGSKTWVNANAICAQFGIQSYWPVKK